MAEGSEAMCDVEDIITRKRDYHPRKCSRRIDCTHLVWEKNWFGPVSEALLEQILYYFWPLSWQGSVPRPSISHPSCQEPNYQRVNYLDYWQLDYFSPTGEEPRYNELLCNWKFDDSRSLQLLEINLGHFWLIWDILIYIRLSCWNNTSVLTTVYIDKLGAETFTNN